MTGENSLLERMVDGKLGPGSDIGPADSQIEGTYRRGYHQAMAEVAYYLKNGGTLSAASLNDWVSEDLRRWRQGKDNAPIHRQILPPAIPGNR